MHEAPCLFRIGRIVPENPHVKTFRLFPESGTMPFSYKAGQHVGIRPCEPAMQHGAGQAWRHYSLCGSPTEKDFIEITVLSQGGMSERLHALSNGDRVEVTSPAGQFVLKESAVPGRDFYIFVVPARPNVEANEALLEE